MQDLESCLAEQSDAMLRAIADTWRVNLDDVRVHIEQVSQLAAIMLDPDAQKRILDRLSLQAREALQELKAQGGAMPAHQLVARYGAVRRLGPARLDRERPWTDPANAAEELYYAGLMFRGYAKVAGRHVEVMHIPEPLLGTLPVASAEPMGETSEAIEAVSSASQGQNLAEDILALLTSLKRQPLAAALLRKSPAEAIVGRPGLGLRERFLGPKDPQRTALLWRLVSRLELLEQTPQGLAPSQRSRAWLRLSDAQRQIGLVVAWRDDSGWNELRHQEGLILEETGWKNDPALARRNLLDHLRGSLSVGWVCTDRWIDGLRDGRPGYMRPDGDMDSWFIRDAETDAYLTGWDSWLQVEGAAARSIIQRELHWLGLVDIGESDEGDALFRLSSLATALWGDRQARSAPPSLEHAIATIGADMVVQVQRCESAYVRFQLERFAEWQATGEQAQFKITADSVWASQNAGITIKQILSFLDRISSDRVPDSVRRALLAWGGRFGRVFVRRALVLQTVDPGTMKQLRSRADVAALLGDELSPTACFVDDDDVNELTSRLKQIGIWPHIKLQ